MVQRVKEEIVSYYLQLLPCESLLPLHSIYPPNSSEYPQGLSGMCPGTMLCGVNELLFFLSNTPHWATPRPQQKP